MFWLLMAFGTALWTINSALWAYYEVILRQDLPEPCIGDVILFARTVHGTYVDGSVLELTWLAGICLTAVAAHRALPRPAPTGDPHAGRSRLGWRLLALPLVCTLASVMVLAALMAKKDARTLLERRDG